MGTPRYSNEFKAEAVRLFKAGNKPVSQLAKELNVAGLKVAMRGHYVLPC